MKNCCSVKVKKISTLELKKYFPLFLIIILSAVISVAIHDHSFMNFFMGYSFIFLSFLKLIDLKGFALGFKNYDPLTKIFTPFGYLYPFLELGVGLYLLRGFNVYGVHLGAAFILLSTGIGIIYQKFIKKNNFSCACMGATIDVPLGAISLFENLIMAGMLLYLVIF